MQQIADGLTKVPQRQAMADVLRRGTHAIKFDPDFVAGKKLSKSEKDDINRELQAASNEAFVTTDLKPCALEGCERAAAEGLRYCTRRHFYVDSAANYEQHDLDDAANDEQHDHNDEADTTPPTTTMPEEPDSTVTLSRTQRRQRVSPLVDEERITRCLLANHHLRPGQNWHAVWLTCTQCWVHATWRAREGPPRRAELLSLMQVEWRRFADRRSRQARPAPRHG